MTHLKRNTRSEFTHQPMGLVRPRNHQRIQVRHVSEVMGITTLLHQNPPECLTSRQLKISFSTSESRKRLQFHEFHSTKHMNCSLIKKLQLQIDHARPRGGKL